MRDIVNARSRSVWYLSRTNYFPANNTQLCTHHTVLKSGLKVLFDKRIRIDRRPTGVLQTKLQRHQIHTVSKHLPLD